MLGALLGAARLGLFSAAYRLLITLTGAGSLLAMGLYPTLSNLHANDFTRFQRTHRHFRTVMLTGGMVATIVGMGLAQPIVIVLLGERYAAVIPTFRILAIDLLCYSARFTYGIALGASGNQKSYTIVSLLGLAVLAVTFIPATKHLGLPGAAASVVLADASVAAGLAHILRRKITSDARATENVTHIEAIP